MATARHGSLSDTLDAALESLRRDLFYSQMAAAERSLRAGGEWQSFVDERDEWMNADLA